MSKAVPKEAKPSYWIGKAKGLFKPPGMPGPTEEETRLRQRQVEDLARLDEEENRRLKGLARFRLGSRSLLGGVGRARSTGVTASAAPAAGANRGGARRGGGGLTP